MAKLPVELQVPPPDPPLSALPGEDDPKTDFIKFNEESSRLYKNSRPQCPECGKKCNAYPN